jgi:thiamine-phosphate diphosphorylase
LVLVSADPVDPPAVDRLAGLLPSLASLVDHVVLRWHGPAREVVSAARRLAAVSPRPSLLLRDRFDLARAAGLEGVQLPEDGVLPAEVRALWPRARIGVSRHDLEGVRDRSKLADFCLVSPVFPTKTKPGARELGPAGCRELVEFCPVPVLALGGVTAERVGELRGTKIAGIAVRSAVLEAADPVAATRRLRAALDSAPA